MKAEQSFKAHWSPETSRWWAMALSSKCSRRYRLLKDKFSRTAVLDGAVKVDESKGAVKILEVVNLVQPENYTKFLSEMWDLSGLLLSWGPDAVTDFLAGWKVSPVLAQRVGWKGRQQGIRGAHPAIWAQGMCALTKNECSLVVLSTTFKRLLGYVSNDA